MRDGWHPGDHLLLRHVPLGWVSFAMPATVVAIDDDELLLWVAPATPCIYGTRADPDRTVRPRERWERIERRWVGPGVLHRIRFGAAHSVIHFWRADGSFHGWYVNLQDPVRPSAFGFDTDDHALDIWIEAGGAWRWKDEDHLDQSVELGLFSRDDAAAIRAEGERVLAEWPFPTGWEDWRPDSGWPVPELPAGWETV